MSGGDSAAILRKTFDIVDKLSIEEVVVKASEGGSRDDPVKDKPWLGTSREVTSSPLASILYCIIFVVKIAFCLILS